MIRRRRAAKRSLRGFLYEYRGRLLVTLVVVGVLLIVPIHGYEFVSGPPEILSNPETGVILLPEFIYSDRARAAQILRCSFLGYWAPESCLPELRVSGFHIWFLRASRVEYHALEPFPHHQGGAYVYNGKLRWLRGRETWEWVDQDFRKLSEFEATLPFQDDLTVENVIRAEGWIRHRLDSELQTFSLGPYRVRYARRVIDDGPTEIVIEEGPVMGTLYSRDEKWHLTWWVERIPELSVHEQQPTGQSR